MAAGMHLRPLARADVPDAARVAARAFAALRGEPPPGEGAGLEPWSRLRYEHLLATDPGSQHAAVDAEGRLVGIACALVREGIWGLSMLAVVPEAQGGGIGRRLLDAALDTAQDARGALITSSSDPRAIRRYARAGFHLLPSFEVTGRVHRERLEQPAGVRPGGLEDLPLTEHVDRAVRGGARAVDLAATMAAGGHLLVAEGGYALHREKHVDIVAAEDEVTARRLLGAALLATEVAADLRVKWITAAQQWAVEVCLDAGLALAPAGPVCVRGDVGPLRPYLMSGAWL